MISKRRIERKAKRMMPKRRMRKKATRTMWKRRMRKKARRTRKEARRKGRDARAPLQLPLPRLWLACVARGCIDAIEMLHGTTKASCIATMRIAHLRS
jgi:hypothetical protein